MEDQMAAIQGCPNADAPHPHDFMPYDIGAEASYTMMLCSQCGEVRSAMEPAVPVVPLDDLLDLFQTKPAPARRPARKTKAKRAKPKRSARSQEED
jgi:hypothetical protein